MRYWTSPKRRITQTPKINMAMETRDLYRQTDVQAKDVLRRCKITANGDRQFTFMQFGVKLWRVLVPRISCFPVLVESHLWK